MDVLIEKRTIVCYQKTFEYSDTREEAAETVVPDTMPDIERLLGTDGTVIIRSKEVRSGTVTVTAGVAANVLYVPEGGGPPCRLDAAVPLSVTADAPGVTEDTEAVAAIALLTAEARVLNPRKVVVRVTAAVTLSCYDRGSAGYSQGVQGADCGDILTRTERAALSPIVCVKEKTFVVADEYRLPAGRPAVQTVLRTTAEIVPDEIKSVGSKLVLKGTVRVGVLYLGADTGGVEYLPFETAFSQLLETDCELTAPDCAATMLLTAVYIEPAALSGGEKGISMEAHMVAQAVCTDTADVTYLSDCYSTRRALTPAVSAETSVCAVRRTSARGALHENLEAPTAVSQVLYAACRAGSADCSGGSFRCSVSAEVLYADENGALQCASGRFRLECPAETEDGTFPADVRAFCAEPYAVPAQKTVDLRVPVSFAAVLCRQTEVRQITALAVGDALPAADASVTVIRAGDGDTLWSLGKRYRSTAAAIAQVNALEEGEALSGRVLLIPDMG